MEKIWLENYPEGIPDEIEPSPDRTLVEFMERTCNRFVDRPAFANMGRELTYGDLARMSRDFAAYLQGDLGLAQGDRIALMLPNVLQYPVALYGALRAGLVVVNVNPLYTARELEHQLNDSEAETIVVLENFAHTLEQCRTATRVKNVIVTGLGDLLGFPKSSLVNFVVRHIKKMVPAWNLPDAIPFSNAMRAGIDLPLHPPDLGPDDIAFLQYTGGTTGVSKGAMLLHRNILSNVRQAGSWVRSTIDEGHEIIITALPLYHIFSLTANCLTYGGFGALNVLITNPRDIPGFIKELGKHRFTAITGVSTLFNALVHHPDFARLDFSPLKLTLGGGMAVQAAVAEKWMSITGKPIVEAYGLTETSPAAVMNRPDIEAYTGTIGLPISSTEISIRDDRGRELGLGEPGELHIRGPQVMKGYWNRPEETTQVLGADGFLATGDVAQVEQGGYVRIVDRKKDMILVSGFNVYPNEVEDVAASHPGVLEVAAVGTPDPARGEVVKLVVVKKDPTLTAEDLMAHCRTELTGYKAPRQVEFRDELPKTNVGKILRRALREKG